MLHKCSYCTYHTTVKYNLRRRMKNKHGNHPKSAQPVAASNPHPYVHPYLNNASQQPYPQRTPEMVANNTYYAKETRAPTKISVGPNGPRAPTTISVPPQIGGVQEGSGIGDQFHRPLQHILMVQDRMQLIEHQLHIMNLDQWLELQQLFLFHL